MKKILAGIALATMSVSAMAEAPGGPNCGWGNMLFNGQSGVGPHFLASITNGTSGNATFGMTTGTKLVHVPFKSLGAALPDLLSGQVQISLGGAFTFAGHIRAKRLRALAIARAALDQRAVEMQPAARAGFSDGQGQDAILSPLRERRVVKGRG